MKTYEQVIANLACRMGLQVSRLGSLQQRFPAEPTEADKAVIHALRPYTRKAGERLWSLLNAVRYVIAEGVPGVFAECGVWCVCSVMARPGELARQGMSDRRIWPCDTFKGMTAPTSDGVEDGNNVCCVADRADDEGNKRSVGNAVDQFTFAEGDAAKTLFEHAPGQFPRVRLDTDWYEFKRVSLEELDPRLPVSGVCIPEDHFEGLGKCPHTHPIGYSSGIFIKTS